VNSAPPLSRRQPTGVCNASRERGASALIVGASGQVGHHLALAADRRNLGWRGTFHGHPDPRLDALDVRDPDAVTRVVLEVQPDYVLIPAAQAHVDRCEIDAESAHQVNVVAVGYLVEAANEVGATVVHFSTDYIFDGTGGPYDEFATANPLSRYGIQKLAAEHLIMQRACDALIVRTTIVYGEDPQRKNFICRLVSALCGGQEVEVASDQISTPTYAPALADAVFDLLAAGARGVFNIAGRHSVARDEFAREAARVFGVDPKLIRSRPTFKLNQLARRPLRAGLCVDLAERHLGWELPGYSDGLRQMLDRERSQQSTASGRSS
jgi:dTDP-4-dehydrorhamnose reductase